MLDDSYRKASSSLLEALRNRAISPLELLPHRDMHEKLVDLVLNGVPDSADPASAQLFGELRHLLGEADVDQVKVVVFGGGTGLSNIIGGDSRQVSWPGKPFAGLKQLFPETRAVVCVTDDGGSTGELLKDVPVIGLGDIRHVLLSSIQADLLQRVYGMTPSRSLDFVRELALLFNYRFSGRPASAAALLNATGADCSLMPGAVAEFVERAVSFCFRDEQCRATLGRAHCLGNLIVLAAIGEIAGKRVFSEDRVGFDRAAAEALYDGISACGERLGTAVDGVMPCTAVPARLRFRYADGVEVTGEAKSSRAKRGAPIDRVIVDYSGRPYVSPRILDHVRDADILIMAPGSLYSSIIPVLQIEEIAQAIRANTGALKLLISNLWVQEGETDKAVAEPERKFHVSDMIKAYEHNLPGGVDGLFDRILCLSMLEVPGSVIQTYAVEGKIPIYLDRDLITRRGFSALQCGFFSRSALLERGVIQHDPEVVARTIKTLYLARELVPGPDGARAEQPAAEAKPLDRPRLISTPSRRYRAIVERLDAVVIDLCQAGEEGLDKADIRTLLTDIVWDHQDIPLAHLDSVTGIHLINHTQWRRDQRWDNVFSFYDPDSRRVNIREDRLQHRTWFEIAFLIALGQALLGDYAGEKRMETLRYEASVVGSIYHLILRPPQERTCYFDDGELRRFLGLARMVEQSPLHFTRTVNGQEGFTPPGLLLGLMYAWYLDNRFASHIEYKMSILNVRPTHLIPEQKKMRLRRQELIDFFRESVFGKEVELL